MAKKKGFWQSIGQQVRVGFRELWEELNRPMPGTGQTTVPGGIVTDFVQRYGVTREGGRVILRNLPIERDSVQAGNISQVVVLPEAVASELQQFGRLGLWNLTLSGYDADPRGLWEVPEARAWYRAAFEACPVLPALLTEATVGAFVLGVLDVETIRLGDQIEGAAASVADITTQFLREQYPDVADQVLRQLGTGGLAAVGVVRIKNPAELDKLVEQSIGAYGQFLIEVGASEALYQLTREAEERIRRGVRGTAGM